MLNDTCLCVLTGPWMMHVIRPDIDMKYKRDIGDGLMSEYLYHANTQNPTYVVAISARNKKAYLS